MSVASVCIVYEIELSEKFHSRAHQRWLMDFVHDQLNTNRRLRMKVDLILKMKLHKINDRL